MRDLPKNVVLSGKARAGLLRSYHTAGRRALLLDYDGTLVPFAQDPKQACPDADLMGLLRDLAESEGNEIAIISGRPRRDLEHWFGELPVALIGEHGAWLRGKGAEWLMLKTLTTEWKEAVRPILRVFVAQLPGALLEEKEFSLAWHYRRANPQAASRRSRELLYALDGVTRDAKVQVLQGNKVVEVRSTGVSKGTAAAEWLEVVKADFVLAIGDDWTDEDMFRALPVSAYSVRVRRAQTAARFFLSNHMAVRRLLKTLLHEPRGGGRRGTRASRGQHSVGLKI